MLGREGAWCSFHVDSGVVENENVIIVKIVFLKDVHCIISLLQNVFVGEVPLTVLRWGLFSVCCLVLISLKE